MPSADPRLRALLVRPSNNTNTGTQDKGVNDSKPRKMMVSDAHMTRKAAAETDPDQLLEIIRPSQLLPLRAVNGTRLSPEWPGLGNIADIKTSVLIPANRSIMSLRMLRAIRAG